jgi:hypothetical protein
MMIREGGEKYAIVSISQCAIFKSRIATATGVESYLGRELLLSVGMMAMHSVCIIGMGERRGGGGWWV